MNTTATGLQYEDTVVGDGVFAKTMLKYQHEAPTTIESVASALEEGMVETKTWLGVVALVPSQQKGFDFQMRERFESIDCPDASPWLPAHRKNCKRSGPGAWTLPGFSTVFHF